MQVLSSVNSYDNFFLIQQRSYLHPSLYKYATANLTRASMLPTSAALKNTDKRLET